MKSKVRVLGHSLHQVLIVFPLGLLATAVIFDVIYLVWGNPRFADVAFWLFGAGIIGGLVAAPVGAIDWLGIPSGTRAKSVGLMHGGANLVAVVIFILSWWLRYDVPANPPMTASILSFVGLAFALVGGWLGGELVGRLGVGVDEGANLNAPNSLTSEIPAPAKAAYREDMARS